MRNPERIDRITKLINELWHKYPDFRFWQIINFLKFPDELIGKDLFYVEDDVWESIFENTLNGGKNERKD